jgi:uncharacterized protein YndB with AHSA1/START domain/uncharacterized damage-inducible protein DinB
MTTTTEQTTSVHKSVRVRTDIERAFAVFTEGFDTWWPRGHHIGKKPLQKAVIEPRTGGRCFGREADGVECQWGTVTAWEPPHRLVIAWQLDPGWQFDPDLSHASEVEVRFTAEGGGMTRVDLDHRHLERHGKDFDKIRVGVSGPGGWSGLLQLFGRSATVYHASVAPLAFILATNDTIAERTFQGVAADDLWKRPTPQTNAMLWILGHMVAGRAGLVKLLGDDVETGLGDLFARGAKLQDVSTYPTREQILEASREVNARLFAKLGALTEDVLATPASRSFTHAVQTVRDQLAFLVMHDTYHVGQLGYVRKALGYEGAVG